MADMQPAPQNQEAAVPPVSTVPPHVRRRRQVLRYLRLAVLVVAAMGFAHLYQRYKLVSVPSESCSPILGVEPGTKLLVDTAPTEENLFLNDLVLYALPSSPGDPIHYSYGRITTPPGSPPGTLRTEAGFWLLGDNPDCPYPDSRSEGTFPLESITARVLFPLRF